MFEYRGRRVYSRVGHELPQLGSVTCVQRSYTTVVPASEQQVACRRHQAAVAAIGPALAPQLTIAPQIHCGKDSGDWDGRKTHAASGIAVTRSGFPKRCKDGAIVDEPIALRRHVQCLSNKRLSSGIGLCSGSCLAGFLWNWSFLYTNQRLTVGAIENI